MIPAALFLLIELHSVDGTAIEINPHSIISMRGRGKSGLFTEGANCMINLADGKYISVKETCDEVLELMKGMK